MIADKYKLIIVGALLVLGIIPSIAGAAFAANPYVGGHQVSGVYYKVTDYWMNTSYAGSNPSQMPCAIQNFASSAGGTGTDRDGWFYQAGSLLWGNGSTCAGLNGDIQSANQVWNMDNCCASWTDGGVNFGSASSISHINQEAVWQNSNSQVEFEDQVTYTSGSSTLYGFQYTPSSYSDPSTYFMAGTGTHSTISVYFLQFGVEGFYSGDYEPNWQIAQNTMGFTDVSAGTVNLSSLHANVDEGDNSQITWDSIGNFGNIGGQIFDYSDETSSTGTVTWKYNQNNPSGVLDGQSLW